MALTFDRVDELAFVGVLTQMQHGRDRGGANARLLDAAYFAGGVLANGDLAAGRVHSAAEIIEKVMTIGAAEIDTFAVALAGYYERVAVAGIA